MYRKKFLDFSSVRYNNKPTYKIWWMNIGVQETVENDISHLFPQFNKKKHSTVTATEQLCLFQATKNDIVILRESPPPEVMRCVEIAKGYIPTILYTEDRCDNYSESIWEDTILLSKIKEQIKGSNFLYMLVPFKVTEFDYKISEFLDVQLFGNIPRSMMDVNDKIISRQICLSLGGNVTQGFDCYNVEEIQEAMKMLYPENTVVIKEFDGVSGQGFFIIHDSQSLKVFNAILRRHKNEERFRLLIEKWYDNCIDINYQIYIGNDGEIIQFPPTRQIINKGVYEGTDFQIEQYINETDIADIESFGQRLAKHLHRNDYFGNISVDTIKANQDLFHLVEINARLSLSSYYWGASQNYLDKKIVIQYYNIPPEKFSLSDFYDNFCGKCGNEGILVLSSGVDHANGTCRVFLMYFADEFENLQFLKSNAEEFIAGEKVS
jgi:hypothetical protein